MTQKTGKIKVDSPKNTKKDSAPETVGVTTTTTQDEESKKAIENLKRSIDSMNKTLEKLQRALIDTTSANKKLTKEFTRSGASSKSSKGSKSSSDSEEGKTFYDQLHKRKENDRVTNNLLSLMKSIDADNKSRSSRNIAKSFAKELKKEGILTQDKKGLHLNKDLNEKQLLDLDQRIREKKTEISQNDYGKTHSDWGDKLYDKTTGGIANFATNNGMAMNGSLMSTGLGLATGGMLNPVLVHQLGLDKLATKALGATLKGAFKAPDAIATALFGEEGRYSRKKSSSTTSESSGKVIKGTTKQNVSGKTTSATKKEPLEKIEKSVEKIEKTVSKKKDPVVQQKEEKDGFFSKLLGLIMPLVSGFGNFIAKFAGLGGAGYMGYQGYQAYKDFKNGDKLAGTQHALKAGVSGIGGAIGGLLGGSKGAQIGSALGAGAAELAEKVGGWLGEKVGDYIWKVVNGFRNMKKWVGDKMKKLAEPFKQAGEWLGNKAGEYVQKAVAVFDNVKRWMNEKLQKLLEPFKKIGQWVANKVNSVKKFLGLGGADSDKEHDERMEKAKQQVAEMRAKQNGTTVEQEMDIINKSMNKRKEEAEKGSTSPVEETLENKVQQQLTDNDMSVATETDTVENGNRIHIVEYSTQSMPNEQSMYMDTLSAQQEQQAQTTNELIEKSMDNRMMSNIDNSTTIVNPSVHQTNAPGMG